MPLAQPLRLIFCALSLLLLSSCDDDPTQPTTSDFPPVTGLNAPQQIGGGWSGPQPLQFLVGDVATDENRVYVVNRVIRGVSVYDASGRHLRNVAPTGLATSVSRLSVERDRILLLSSHLVQTFDDSETARSISRWFVEDASVIDATLSGGRVLALVDDGSTTAVRTYSSTGILQKVDAPVGPVMSKGPGIPFGNIIRDASKREIILLGTNGIWWYDLNMAPQGWLDTEGIMAVGRSLRRWNDVRDESAIAMGPDGVVVDMTQKGVTLGRWSRGRGLFASPIGMALTNSGKVVASDATYNRMVIIGPSTEPPHVFENPTVPGRFIRLAGMAVSPGGELFVADMSAHNVQVFDRNGEPQRHFGRGGTTEGQLTAPDDIVFNATGDLLIADRHAVHRFTADGTFAKRWPVNPEHRLLSIDVDPANRVFALTEDGDGFAYVHVFDQEGNALSAPQGLEPRWNARRLRVDRQSDRAYLISVNSVYVYQTTETPNPGLILRQQWPLAISSSFMAATIDAFGRLYVGDSSGVTVFDEKGHVVSRWNSPAKQAMGMAIDPDGSLWLGDWSERIYQFAPIPE